MGKVGAGDPGSAVCPFSLGGAVEPVVGAWGWAPRTAVMVSPDMCCCCLGCLHGEDPAEAVGFHRRAE